MFDFTTFIQFINKNGDNIISKKEIKTYLKTQAAPSIFTEYFNSIKSDVSIDDFINNIDEILDNNIQDIKNVNTICFKSPKYKEAYDAMMKENTYDNCLKFFSWKCENQEEFDKLYNQFFEEAESKGFNNIVDRFRALEPTKPITLEGIKLSKQHSINLPDDLVFSGDIDWSKSADVLQYISFNEKTFSQTPPEHLPPGFDPQKVIENGKTIGLGIDKAHEKGYTGKGVSIAICDWQLKPHDDINIKEEDYYKADYASTMDEYFHASAVSSIAVGKNTGIAPDARLFFCAEYQDNSPDGGSDMINSLKTILEKNKTLPDNEKIRVVSISGIAYGGNEAKQLVEELERDNVWVLDSSSFWKDFAYLKKKDPAGDPNDFNNYEKYSDKGYNALYVNSGNRTVADPSGEDAYRHDSRASASWAIPVVAGYYALACQADPNMTKETFIRLANETAHIIQSTDGKLIRHGDDATFEIGRSEETYPTKVIDINALLEAIENEKANKTNN